MTRQTKILLIVLIPIMIVLGILYMLVNAVYIPQPEAVVFPQGELTDSIFTEQNNNYTENDSLKVKHVFQTVPYTVDVTEGDGAKVGSGTIYRIEGSDGFFIYASEYNDSTNAQDVISSQFPAALLINYVPEQTRVTVQVDKKGFINGFSAEYIAETIVASDGTERREAAILGYALDFPDVEYAAAHVFIGVGTTNITTEGLEACEQILSAVMNTMTKDPQLESQRKSEAERLALEEQAALISSVDDSADTTTADAEQPPVAKTATIPIPVDKSYSSLTVTVDWDNINPDAVLELFNPDKTVYYDPSMQDDTSARFVIQNASDGAYELHIANADQCGAIRTSHSGMENLPMDENPASEPEASGGDTPRANDILPGDPNEGVTEGDAKTQEAIQ